LEGRSTNSGSQWLLSLNAGGQDHSRRDTTVDISVSGLPQIDWGNVQLDVRQTSTDKSDFFQTLEGAMNKVQEVQGADQEVTSVLQGNGQDLHSAMIAVEKADLTFQMMMQVRNKIVQAYQTISQMQF
jgi:flagellar hook-basal body complex protein FliE